MKIKAKLILSFLAVIILFIMVGFFSINAAKVELEKTISGSSVNMLEDAMTSIDKEIYVRIEDNEEFVTRPLIRQVVEASNVDFEKMVDIDGYIRQNDTAWINAGADQLTPLMQSVINHERSDDLRQKINFLEKKYGYKIYPEIFITNKYGANVIQSGRTSDYYQADEEWWQKTKADGTYVSDVEYDDSSNFFSLTIGTRMNDQAGAFTGVMKTVVNIEETFKIIEEEREDSSFKSTQDLMVNSKGQVIYDSENRYKILDQLPNDGIFSRAGSQYGYFKDAEGGAEENLVVYSRSAGFKDFTGLGWVLFEKIQSKEIEAPIIDLIKLMSFASLMGVLVAFLFGLIIYRSISGPITKLSRLAKEVSRGNLNLKIDINSSDEIGEFARTFGQMTIALKQSKDKVDAYGNDLENKVNERTKDLEKSKLELEAKVCELNKFNNVAVDRELKMIKLKKQIKDLEDKDKK